MTPISRRHHLKGLTLGAGALVLSPMVQRLRAEAEGGALPRRVVFVVEANGLFRDHIQPKTLPLPKNFGSEKLIDEPMAKHELPDAIAALSPYKDRITVVQGLSGRISEGGTGGHSTNYGALGCFPGNKGPMAQTIDLALADALPSVVPHIGLGIVNNPTDAVHFSLSAVGAGKASPIHCRPELAYKVLFGSVAPGAGRQAFDLKTNLLDYMADDVKSARSALAGEERQKMDRYLEAFESLRDRQGKVEKIEGAMRKYAPAADKFTSAVETDRLQGQFDLAASALICGLTNTITLTSGGGGQHYIRFAGLGLPVDGHGLGHGASYDGKTWAECRAIIRKFHAGLIAGLAKRLDAVKEGQGSMLDNTLIVYMSDSGESHHPTLHDWPVLLLGNLGGKVRSGRAIEYPKYGLKGHRTMSNLFQTLLHAAGKPRDRFGMADPKLLGVDQKGPLSELLA